MTLAIHVRDSLYSLARVYCEKATREDANQEIDDMKHFFTELPKKVGSVSDSSAVTIFTPPQSGPYLQK